MYVNLLFLRDRVNSVTGRIYRAGRVYPNQPEGAANLLIRRGFARRMDDPPDDQVQPPAKRRPKR
jgi:hypothetical protein